MAAPLRLLLADDNLPDRLLAEAAFEHVDAPTEVTYCENGQQVLATLLDPDSVKPDVVVLDLNMPVMDGHETLQRMRAHPALTHDPVVILSSSRDEADIARAYDELATLYLVKHQDFPTFVAQMEALTTFYGWCHFPAATGT
ncbi:response regulator [Deinococcus sedimenti]|uniref:Response regulator n=1 Tax=Deinococcus sedimenti TaxID=1867090 RepID=A0ABQ2SC01_9DEIO|nr:response regulator [Deinococcus sedimenti]GGS10215.1 response regulator [Deinococcus sedimenti]